MARGKLNSWINALLVIFLLLTIGMLRGPRTVNSTGGYSSATYIHAASGMGLMAGIVAHIWLHRGWFKAFLAGKMKGMAKGRLIVNSCVGFFALLACFSGYAEFSSPKPNAFHHAMGFLALLGMIPHTIRGIVHTIRGTSGRRHRGALNPAAKPRARETRTALSE